MRPGEILDARNDFQHRLGDPLFVKIQNVFGTMEWGRSGGWTRGKEMSDTEITDLQGNLLRVADVYRVSHDMSALVQVASMGLSSEDTFDWSLAPTRNGFVSFDRPLEVVDQRGQQMLIHFLLWGAIDTGTGIPATIVWGFNDTYRQPDEVAVQLMADMAAEEGGPERVETYNRGVGRWAPVTSQVYFNGQSLGPAMIMGDDEAAQRLMAEGIKIQPGSNVLRYVHSLWLMMGQTIARVESDKPERPARRRAVKMNLPSAVTVVRLRREGAPSTGRKPGESQVEWNHRWVVKGHWRWQVCGENHPLAQEQSPGVYRARMWINPFVKGPESAPFRQSEKVYSLER